MIEPIDSLEIAVIVDNVTDNLSSNPKYVETEVVGASLTSRYTEYWAASICQVQQKASFQTLLKRWNSSISV
jgi:hypothetical protein